MLGAAAMDDDSRVIDKGWDTLPAYDSTSGDADDAVTVSISTTPGEWLVNTMDSVVVPMSMAEVVDSLRVHKLSERSLVWRAGMQEWAAIEKVPQLKLAARMAPSSAPAPTKPAPSTPAPSTLTPSAPTPSVSATRASEHPAGLGRPASKAPPARPTPVPQSLSRKATLPFGLPVPHPASRPTASRPSQPKEPALPPSASAGESEPGVLAVYDRPAATISFDLSPSEPARVPAPVPAAPPQTLAPTTSDTRSVTRPPSRAAQADLSVVAASQFRAVQRSSKRLLVVCSLASAAAASVLTFWLSQNRAAPAAAPLAARAPEPVAAAVGAPAASPAPLGAAPVAPAASAAPAPSAAPAAVAEAPPKAAAPAPPKAAAPKAAAPATPKAVAPKAVAPKAARKPKAVAAVPSAAEGSTESPTGEPNPYDVKLDDEATTPKPAATRPPISLQEQIEREESATASGTTSPGF